MASILVVCTGNICRSPLAEAFLQQLLTARFPGVGPSVASAGLAGWEGSGAHPETILAAQEHGLDLSEHVCRRLLASDVEEADLVLAMAAEHRDAVAGLVPAAAPRTFTLKELARLVKALPPAAHGPGFDPEAFRRRVRDAHDLRVADRELRHPDEDVPDPLGHPPEAFRAVAWEIQSWAERLVEGLFGRAQVPASPR